MPEKRPDQLVLLFRGRIFCGSRGGSGQCFGVPIKPKLNEKRQTGRERTVNTSNLSAFMAASRVRNLPVKKIVAFGLAALALMMMTQQQASAWKKCTFGVGLNLGWEGANNSVLWGVLKGGPGPGMDGGYGGFGDPGFGYGAHGFASGPQPFGPGGFEPSYASPMNSAMPPSPELATPPARRMPQAPGSAQPVGYFPYADPALGYYPPTYAYGYPMYYYPAYGR
jgi:hypothetical protein